VRGGVIYTPDQNASILDGITRSSVMEIAKNLGHPVQERHLTRSELYLADEVFCCGTAAEVVPIREIDDHTIGTGEPGPVTRGVQAVYEDAITGRADRYREWLDVVQVPSRAG
jgi:branched-chain amino acid aminotransferase